MHRTFDRGDVLNPLALPWPDVRVPSHRDDLSDGEAWLAFILRDDADRPRELGPRHARQRPAVKADRSFGRMKSSEQETNERRLAGAIWAEQRAELPASDIQ